MTERIIDPEEHLSDIVATRRWAYLDEHGDLLFTDVDAEAQAHWHARVTPGDYVPKSLPLEPPVDLGADLLEAELGPSTMINIEEPRSMYPEWMLRLQRSRNGVEIVVASIVAGTAGAFVGFAIALTH